MNLSDVSQILGVVTTILIAISGMTSVFWFVWTAKRNDFLRDEQLRRIDRKRDLMRIAISGEKPVRKQPEVKRERIEDVGIVAYINQ